MKIFRSILAALFAIASLSILFDLKGNLLDNIGGFLVGMVITYFITPKSVRKIILEKIGFDRSRLDHLDSVKKDIQNSELERDHVKNEIDQLKQTKATITNDVAEVKKLTVETELNRIDKLDGHDFEKYCGHLLEKLGFSDVNVTVGSGDQGIDVLASMGSTSYGFQCKNYSSTVGNKSVQEALAGRTFYKVDRVGVITNNYFTASAKKLATEGSVELWDRDTLKGYLDDDINQIQFSGSLTEPAIADDSSDWSDF